MSNIWETSMRFHQKRPIYNDVKLLTSVRRIEKKCVPNLNSRTLVPKRGYNRHEQQSDIDEEHRVEGVSWVSAVLVTPGHFLKDGY